MEIAPTPRLDRDPITATAEAGCSSAALAVTGESMHFETLLRRHQAMVFSTARHFLNDPGRAEDIAQDVFLQLHGELSRLECEKHVVAWLRRVTAHRSIDALRSPAAARATSLDQVGELQASSREADVLLRDRLRRLVASLPEQQRIAVILRYQEDLDPGDIAEVMQMPVATVKSHLRRALDCLRQKAKGISGLPGSGKAKDSTLRSRDAHE